MQRVAIVGCIGAGKSTVARRLGALTGLPVVHLDRCWWRDGRYRITGKKSVKEHTLPAQEFRDLQLRVAAEDAWIIDGNYSADLDTRLTRADTVIFLDLPRQVCLWRLVRRHGRRRADYPDQVREGFGWLLTLVRWVVSYPSRKRPALDDAIARYCPSLVTIVRLQCQAEVDRYLTQLERLESEHRLPPP